MVNFFLRPIIPPMPAPVFMHRCLELASLGRGMVGNGALVGAVLVRAGKVIAEAFHRAYGEAHAERALLESIACKVLPQDVLYVNLEPCCHHGKTTPCTDIIIEKGVKTVVYGMADPDSRVAGNGLEKLRREGIVVIGPFERALCERLNKGFIQTRTSGRPYITLKKAISLNGSIANKDGSRLNITSSEQDVWAHSFLRARHDAILVGVGTIISDNPRLNIRFALKNVSPFIKGLNRNKLYEEKCIQPYRIVMDPNFRIPVYSKVVLHEASRTILCINPEAAEKDRQKKSALDKNGVRFMLIPCNGDLFVWESLWHAFITPQNEYHGITSILIEGGAKTWETFVCSGMMDEDNILIGRRSRDVLFC